MSTDVSTVQREHNKIQQIRILNTGYALANVIELVTNVMLNLSKKDKQDSFPVNSLNRSVLSSAIANRIKEKVGV